MPNIRRMQMAASASSAVPQLWGFGNNGYGNLGDGTTTYRYTPVLSNDNYVTSWDTGTQGARAVLDDGTLWTWGKGTNGRLGDGTTVHKSSPVQVGSLTNWATVESIRDATIATKTDGTLWTWGDAEAGKTGQGGTTDTSSPVQIGTETSWLIARGGYNMTFVSKMG